jgi:hypothetical protein
MRETISKFCVLNTNSDLFMKKCEQYAFLSVIYTYDENGPVVTDTMSYFPIVHRERATDSVSYYYADG